MYKMNFEGGCDHLKKLLLLNNYVSDINYIYDKSKKITLQAKSDIIRLSLLKKYGGIMIMPMIFL